MKWCFLVNPAPLVIEFFGKLAKEVVRAGDEYIVVVNSKIAEYEKMKYFPKNSKFLSEVDWCRENYNKNHQDFQDLSWKELFPEFDRFNFLKLYNFNYPNSVNILSQSYQFANFVFQTEKPDVIAGEAPTGIFDEIFYFFCQKHKSTYLGFLNSRLKNRIDIYDLESTCSKYKETFNKIKDTDISQKEKESVREFIDSLMFHKELIPCMDFEYRHMSVGQIGRIKGYLKREKEMMRHYLKYLSKRKYYRPFDYNSEFLINYILRYPWEGIKSRLRILEQKNIFDSSDDNDKFFLYPLQLQPESSTEVRAMYFCDQLNTIKNTAFSLPFPYKLYIKEHPMAVSTKPTSFYKEIKEIPNTVLVRPYENVENLIRKSQGVITLTSTIGMEAILSGKPCYALGDVIYDHHPLCRKVDNFEDLRQKIAQDIAKKPFLNDLENINVRFITSYLRNTVPGELAEASRKTDNNDYQIIYQEIKKIFFYDKNEKREFI